MSSIVNSLNILAFHAVLGIASPWLNTVMSLLAQSYYLIIPIVAIYLFLKKDKSVFSFVIGAVVVFIVTDIIKMIVMEPRPCSVSDLQWINHVGCESSYSFPSNHATVLTGLSFFLAKYKYLRVLYIIWVVLVLFGRVYLGAHYLTDVIVGVVLSIIFYYIILKKKDVINNICSKILYKIAKPIYPKEFANN